MWGAGGDELFRRGLFGRGGEAVEFPEGVEWLNTDHPIALGELKGRIVLLDFWTYCCINCMHVIPDLRRLEERYPELVVIGVHSAKFRNERDASNVSAAILRYHIEHPVIVDNGFALWQAYGIHAWPSFVLIDPAGNVAGQGSGEGVEAMFDDTIASLARAFGDNGLLRRDRMRFALLRDTAPRAGVLSFPGKVVADERGGGRLFVSDSDHNRILVLSPEGVVLDTIGTGAQGREDGAFAKATFLRPQGLAHDPAADALYVADTDNHLVRRADLRARTVATVLGTGAQGGPSRGGRGTAVAISSPWDLVILGPHLYVAMAGTHTIWRMDLTTLEAERWAGSGAEDIRDGPRRGAALAQPSGLATDGASTVFIADSEVSAVRAVEDDGVRTIIGQGLFEFGDVDGTYPAARLQHPIGIAWRDGLLYVADTYNHKVKVVDPRARTSRTLVGTGERGRDDGPAASARLNEPNGLAFLGGRLHIADTNNDALRVYDPATGAVTTLAVRTAASPPQAARARKGPAARVVRLPAVRVSPRARAVTVRIEPPQGSKWTPDAPNSVAVTAEGGTLRAGAPEPRLNLFDLRVPIEPLGSGEDATTLRVRATAYHCQMDGSLCRFDVLELEVPLEVAQGGADEPAVHHRLDARG